jgi:hypothetical protein
MPLPKPPLSAWVASGALCAITLFVFGVLQDYGPEAAIRKFHTALSDKDPREIAYLSYPPSTVPGELTPSASELTNFVYGNFIFNHATVQLYAMSRRPEKAAAVVTYRFPNGREWAMTWIVRKTDRVWKIDTDATVDGLPMGLSRTR